MTKSICYYVSGHGLGHASRAAQVMRQLPAEIPLIVKSAAPESFFRRESGRVMTFVPQRFDVGCCQKSNVEINWLQTLEEAQDLTCRGRDLIQEEARFLAEANAGIVVADVPSLPLAAARQASIPSVAVANFTWVEIFAGAVRRHPGFLQLIRTCREQYRSATLALRTPLSFPMSYFPSVKDVPLIARVGENVRRQLCRKLCVPESRRLVLLYFGGWGASEMRLDRLHQMQEVSFVAFAPMPPPVHVLDPDTWHFPDVVAAADAVVAKPGYGTIGECMANGTPMIYYPRREFAEYVRLRQGVENWGGGVRLSRRDFLACRWAAALEEAASLTPPRVPANGASVAADEIVRMWHGA